MDIKIMLAIKTLLIYERCIWRLVNDNPMLEFGDEFFEYFADLLKKEGSILEVNDVIFKLLNINSKDIDWEKISNYFSGEITLPKILKYLIKKEREVVNEC